MTLFAWGANSHGQLGLGTVTEQEGVPVEVTENLVKDVRGIEGGGGHTLLCDKEGRLFATGWNKAGQLGLGHTEVVTVFTKVDMSDEITSMTAGWDFSLILSASGEVFACGSNSFGQLGLGDESVKNVANFVKVPGLSQIVRISAGLRHAGCVDNAGRVYTWGAGSRGQLGGGEKIKIRWSPGLVTGMSGFASDISCGQYFTLVRTESSLCGFGDNKFHQVLNTGSQILLNPTIIDKFPDSISTGWTHTLVLEGGQVKAWGRNNYYQLGGKEGDVILTNVLKAFAGSEHCICLTEEGMVYAWGWNEHGNCGVGVDRFENVETPERVSFPHDCDVLDIFVGSAHCFAILRHRI